MAAFEQDPATKQSPADQDDRVRSAPPGCILVGALFTFVALLFGVAIAVLAPSVVKTLRANDIVTLIGDLAWPVCLVLVGLYFSGPLVQLLNRIKSVNAEAGGVKMSLDTAQTATQLGVQLAMSNDSAGTPPSAANARDIAAKALVLASPQNVRAFSGKRLLWLTGRITKIRFLIQAFETLGIRVDYRTAIEDAGDQLAARTYDVVISSMTLPADKLAGYHSHETLATIKSTPPFAILSEDPMIDPAETKRRGKDFVTASPAHLFNWVMTTLAGKQF